MTASPAERSPLSGIRVVNTRGPRQAGELDALLEARGARPIAYPCIDIGPALDPLPLDEALRRAAGGDFQWLVFTSANAVEAVETRLEILGIAATQLPGIRVAAVGPGTAAAVEARLGVAVDLYPEEHQGEALAGQLVALGARSVLVPQAERAREALVRILGENGVEVEAVTAYRTILGSAGADVPRLLHERGVDVVTFASPSAVDNLALRLDAEGGDWADLGRVCVACIGPVTAEAAERRGLAVQVTARKHTVVGLVESLERYYGDSLRMGEQKP
jgi:uroporphyrinogen III methyltransferase/synthase